MKDIRLRSPKSIAELIETLEAAQSKCLLLAGCTDILADFKKHLKDCEQMVDLSGISEMRYIKLQDNELIIGALTTFTELSESRLVRDNALCLAQAAGSVGSPQIRNRATIGGNTANCSPAADSIPALLALTASIRYIDSQGKLNKVTLEEFLKGETVLMKDNNSFIESFCIPIKNAICYSGFVKLGSRSQVTISRLSMAAAFSLNSTGRICDPKLSLGSVGKTAFRVAAAEKLMDGRQPDDMLIKELGLLLSGEIEERLKDRASMPYKRKAVIGLLQDLFRQ